METTPMPVSPTPHDAVWVDNVRYLWLRRRMLLRVTMLTGTLGLIVALLSPNQYESSTRIMPPQQTGTSAAMLAALAGRGATQGGLAGVAGSLLGGRSNGALFVSLLRSGSIAGRLIDRFELQRVYGKRYRQDTARRLSAYSTIAEDTKSGVITIAVRDRDRQRAKEMAQAYVEELNLLVARVNTSSARREREFIETRIADVKRDLDQAQQEMSAFSASHTAIDIREQTRATVDSGARLQGQLIAAEGELDSLGQIYGADNVRLRAAQARVGLLRKELEHATGGEGTDETHPYPALKQLPALAVPWANLYRRVRTQETVLEMLSAQYETARIEEAKDIPTVSVIDAAGVPEKKSSPHRLLIVVGASAAGFGVCLMALMARRSWDALPRDDRRRVLGAEIGSDLHAGWSRVMRRKA